MTHDAIRRAQPIVGELGFGWLTHYAVGIVFAGMLLALQGTSRLDAPAVGPALAWGLTDRFSRGPADRTAGAPCREPAGVTEMTRAGTGRFAGLPPSVWLIAWSGVPLLGGFAVACGLTVGLTGLWMTLASAIPSGLQGELLRGMRQVRRISQRFAGVAWTSSPVAVAVTRGWLPG